MVDSVRNSPNLGGLTVHEQKRSNVSSGQASQVASGGNAQADKSSVSIDLSLSEKVSSLAGSPPINMELVNEIRENSPFTTHIIIEVENIKQAKDAVMAGADIILLDEIEPDILQNNIKLLKSISKQKERNLIIEVSGIKPEQINNYLIEGVDLISTSSSVTKSNWIDLSMRYID